MGSEIPMALPHTPGLLHPQIWYLLEGNYQMYKLFPSKGWEVYISLQVMHQSSLYAPSETMVTLFYEDSNLYQVPGGGLWGVGGAETCLTPAHLVLPSHHSWCTL